MIVTTIVTILILSLDSSRTINCDHAIFSYHWFVIDGIDLGQSLICILSAIFIVRYMKGYMKQNEYQSLSTESKQLQCLLK